MQNNSCCFVGDTSLPLEKIEKIVVGLDREIERLIADGVTDFISGGNLGFEQIAASLIAAKKEMGKNIRLIFVLSHKTQADLWGEKQRALYQNLLNEADEIIYVSEQCDSFCIKLRSKYMVDHSTYCICALQRKGDIANQTVEYARERGLQIVNVAQ